MAKKAAPRRETERVKPRREPVYTIMVFVTFVAMLVGITLMYLDNEEYGGKSPPKESPPTLPKLGGEPARTTPGT